MKKRTTLLLSAVAVVAGAFAVNAGILSLTTTSKTDSRLAEQATTVINTEKVAATRLSDNIKPATKAKAKALKAVSSMEDVVGTYRMTGTTLLKDTPFYDSYPTISINEKGDSLHIDGFTAYGRNTLNAELDVANSQIIITPGQVALHNTYYDADIYYGTYGSAFDTTTPIVGTINEDGSISFDQWVGIGFSQGFFQFAKDVVMQPSNGAMEMVTGETTSTIPVWIEQAAPKTVTVYHFAGYEDNPIAINLAKGGDATITSQVLTDYTPDNGKNYYDVFTSGLDESGDPTEDNSISGTADENEIVWGAWNTLLNMPETDTETGETVDHIYNFYNTWYPAGAKASGKIYYTDGSTFKIPTVDALQGGGTEEDPFLISNLEELAFFASTINEDGKDYTDQFVLVTDDIDATGYAWVPIGDNSHKWTGTFDGGNHTINGISYANPDASYIGFFAYNQGVIKNLNLTNANFAGKNYVGAIAGYNYTSSNTMTANTVIENCTVDNGEEGWVYGTNYVGGITGLNNGTIKGCVGLEGAYVQGQGWAGGLVGKATRGVQEGCEYYGYVIGTGTSAPNKGFGGIAGSSTANAQFNECVFAGVINGSRCIKGAFGGILGASEGNTTIYSSVSAGTIQGDSIAGGIAGQATNLTINDSYNLSLVRGIISISGYQAGASGIAGGLIGKSISSTVNNCYNKGNVYGTLYHNNSYYTNNGLAGGLIGVANANANTNVSNCANFGSVAGAFHAGGILGNGGGVYTNVYNAADITATSSASGGLVGTALSNLTIDGGYNIGKGFNNALVGATADDATEVTVNASYVTDFGATDTYGTGISVKDLAAYSAEEAPTTGVRRLRSLEDADAWEYGDQYTLPTLKGIDTDAAKANAAAVVLKGANDTYDNVTNIMYVGLPDGATWTFSNPVLAFAGNNPAQVNILEASTEEVTLTVTVGEETKAWTVKLNTTKPQTAIENIDAAAQGVKSVRYFNLQGVESAEPVDGVNIVVKTMDDGTIQVQKAVK